jgi:hypothetical protein
MDREKLEELRTRKHEAPPGGIWASGLGPKITFAERDALFAYLDELQAEVADAWRIAKHWRERVQGPYDEPNPSDTAPP